MTLWVILVVFTAAVIWAWLGRVDVVAVAAGRVIPTGHSKQIQPLEIGTIRAVHVTEGAQVRAGDLLIELDTEAVGADVARLESEVQRADAEAARLTRLVEGTEATSAAPIDPDTTGDDLLSSQWRSYSDTLGVLARERDRLDAQALGVRGQIAKLRDVLEIVAQRVADEAALVEQKLFPRQQYLATEQERLGLFHDLATERARLGELDAATAEVDARRRQVRSDFRRDLLERREQAERRADVGRQELAKARHRLTTHRLRAPVDGVVQQLAVHSIGAVVTPAEELLVVVPADAGLEVEAVLENKDVGFIEAGQTAAIKVEAFPFTRYGLIDGEVMGVSRDAVIDERGQLVFKMRVRLSRQTILVNGREVPLSPGMNVTAEVKTGQRQLLDYFLSPLKRYRDESVRER
jgi:hemolysin D